MLPIGHYFVRWLLHSFLLKSAFLLVISYRKLSGPQPALSVTAMFKPNDLPKNSTYPFIIGNLGPRVALFFSLFYSPPRFYDISPNYAVLFPVYALIF